MKVAQVFDCGSHLHLNDKAVFSSKSRRHIIPSVARNCSFSLALDEKEKEVSAGLSFNIPLWLKVTVLLLMFSLANQVDGQTRYSITDIGAIPPGAIDNFWAKGVNDSGHVIGIAGTEGFRLKNGVFTHLGSLGWGPLTVPNDINNSGSIVGSSATSGGEARAFVWANGTMTNLGVLANGTISEAFGINEQGDIVGQVRFESSGGLRAFFWRGGTMVDIGTIGGRTSASAKAINDSGWVVGETYGSLPTRAFRWKDGTMLDLGVLPTGVSSWARAINDSGDIVGTSTIAGLFTPRGFIWRNGVMTDLGALDTTQTVVPVDINNTGQVIGYQFAPLGYRSFIWSNGVMRALEELIDSADGWILSSWPVWGINDRGVIVGAGHRNGARRGYILTPKATITRPQPGERWIAGEQDTIRWSGQTTNGWEVFFSTNDGFSYTRMDTILLPAARELLWRVPDNLATSSECRIKVVDALDGDIVAVGEAFTIRAYDLVRTGTNGSLEAYQPSLHGWSIPNAEDVIWPATWYGQFNYRTGDDPFTLNTYHRTFAPFTRAEPADFPDWPAFVNTFGVAKCYQINWFGTVVQPKERAMEAWAAYKGAYEGSCFGFPLSALLAFEQTSGFFNQNPLLPSTPTIFDLTAVIPMRKTIVKYFIYQSDATGAQHRVNNLLTVSVRELLEDLREMFLDDNGPHRILALNPPRPGGHAVIPYKLERDPGIEGQFNLYVYDPNEPGEHGELIVLDSLANTWQEFLGLNYGLAHDGLFLDLPVTHFLQQPIHEFLEEPLSDGSVGSSSAISRLSLYTRTPSDLLLLSSLGDSLGYVGGRLIRTMPDAAPIIPFAGGLTEPIGYSLPSGRFSLVMDQFRDTLCSILFSEGGVLYRYERVDVDSTQRDRIGLGNGISLKSDEPKTVRLKTIGGSGEEFVFEFLDMPISSGDSVAIAHLSGENLRLENFGAAKSYDLRARLLNRSGDRIFEYNNVVFPANTTHYLVATDSVLTSMRILVDVGNNGTIDDTLFVANTVDVEDRGSLELPTEYNLAQNFPNPFNPATQIEYSLPYANRVKLSVFNVLGQLVTTLVDEERPAGRFSVEWNGTSSNGNTLGSGVYFYSIVAQPLGGGQMFTRTGKMIFMK